MAVERPLGLSLVAMKVVVVALFVAAAAFAPARSAASMDPVMATIVDREWDATRPAVEPEAKPKTEPQSDADLGVTRPAGTPERTLPPTDTALPAVDSRH